MAAVALARLADRASLRCSPASTDDHPGLRTDVVMDFLSRLDEAVKLEVVSDVPFGAFLSGGLDSWTIVALMSRRNSMVKTFSVGFGEGPYSELSYAARASAGQE